jgi:hypothetical protein
VVFSAQMLHVWNIYLPTFRSFRVNDVGQYSIHGASGYIGKWSVYRSIDHLWVIYDNLDLNAIYTDHDGISWEPYNGVD